MLQENPLWHRFTARLHIIVAMLVALVLTGILAVSAGTGDLSEVVMVMMGLACIAVVLMLGDKYWLLIPFAFSSQLPAFPIRGRFLELPEIVAVLCTLTFMVRYAVKRQKFSLFRKQHAPFLLYVGWVAFIFLLHPIGFSGLADSGLGLGGARFYAKILLALAAFLIMANQTITEEDCKWIIGIFLAGGILGSAYNLVDFFAPLVPGGVDKLNDDPDAIYSWHQMIAGIPILLISLAFAKYKSSEIFSMNRLWLVGGLALCVVLVAMSGKRSALASIPVFAVLAAFLRREWGFFMLWIAGAFVAGTIIVVGHGELFHLPLTVQRAFSVLPANWDAEIGVIGGGSDEFRTELRRQALKKIEKDPWIGTGYQVDLALSDILSRQYATLGGDIEAQVTPFAMGSAWHNTWLAYAADFGIPASIIAALIFFAVISASYRLAARFPPQSMRAILASYIFLITCGSLFRSHTSGHSALDAYDRWWLYGALVSLGITFAKSLESKIPGVALAPPIPPQPGARSAGRPLRCPVPGPPACARALSCREVRDANPVGIPARPWAPF